MDYSSKNITTDGVEHERLMCTRWCVLCQPSCLAGTGGSSSSGALAIVPLSAVSGSVVCHSITCYPSVCKL